MLGKIEKILISNKEFIIYEGVVRVYIPHVMQFVDKIYLMDNGNIILEGYIDSSTAIPTYMNIDEQIGYIESYLKSTKKSILRNFINYLNEAKEKLKQF